MSLESDIEQIARQAHDASQALVMLSDRKKNKILNAMADELAARRDDILTANEQDLAAGAEAGLSQAMLDRLKLTPARFDSMIKGISNLVGLKDPVGKEISNWVRPNGLEISKVRVPIGVIAIIYESRPNVTADAASLCFKSSNAVILRGGKEAFHSNQAIAKAIQEGGEKKGLPPNAIQLLQTTDRAAIKPLVQMSAYLDLVIPRGGESLIRTVTELATVPVIKHYTGLCHTYVDASADPAMALAIAVNAKVQRPGVCNAMETLLVHVDIADDFLPKLAPMLADAGVEIRGDAAVCACIPAAKPAADEDWDTEYLDLILSIKVVGDHREAIDFINTHGSKHSDAVVAEDAEVQADFLNQVDASTVYVNASTRFTDGAEFGMGAEIGISTDKLHARGPMGLEELTTYKYLVRGTGQIRD